MNEGFTGFDTIIGRMGISWTNAGIAGLRLPETRVALPPVPDDRAMPPEVAEAVRRIRALLDGHKDDLRDIRLDCGRTRAFERRVYEAARAVGPGTVSSYGEVAASLGDPCLALAVGQALGRNPWPVIVPCHRIVGAGGRAGGFSAPGGASTKLRLLELEGALAPEMLPLFAASPPKA